MDWIITPSSFRDGRPRRKIYDEGALTTLYWITMVFASWLSVNVVHRPKPAHPEIRLTIHGKILIEPLGSTTLQTCPKT